MNIFSQIEHMMDLTDNEKIVSQYIQEHPEDFVKMSASDIAKHCFVSTSSIYRLCQKLGLSGLSELKVQMSASIHDYQKEQKNFDYNYPFKKNQTQYQITQQLKQVYEQTVIASQNLIDLDQLRLIVSRMRKAKFIDIYTSAGHIYFAQNFKFQMQEIGIHVNVPVEDYQQGLTATCSTKEHIAIIISFGARGASVKRISKILKKTQTPIVLISSTLQNPLEEYADYTLYMSSYEDHYQKISSFSTRLSLLYILDCLYTCYFEGDYENNIQNKIAYYERMTSIEDE